VTAFRNSTSYHGLDRFARFPPIGKKAFAERSAVTEEPVFPLGGLTSLAMSFLYTFFGYCQHALFYFTTYKFQIRVLGGLLDDGFFADNFRIESSRFHPFLNEFR
jgi:hypothetical protein